METFQESPDDVRRYGTLLERAMAFVGERPEGVPEDMLVAHVFGSATSPALWRDLLRSVLADAPSLQLDPDGIWRGKSSRPTSDFPPEFVVVDVETTGLKSRYHRITEIAIIRISRDGEKMFWSSLVNPERRIPRQISRLTGIDDRMVATAPRFASIAPTVIELIGDQLIVGHNVSFDIGFLNTELARAGHPRLVNQSLDTLSLADAMLPDLRRLSLTEVTRHLGIRQSEAHRAAADAGATLEVLNGLREIAGDAGDASLETLASLASSRRTRRPKHRSVSRGRSVLDSSHLEGVPQAPGVYIMRDNGERVIYVGKAKNLRKRLASYYSQPLGYTRKMDGLLESIDRIHIETTGSELEALVLESQLIRRYRPRFNSQQRNAEQYCYIRVDVANPWPTVTLSKDYKADGARYFGPFKSARHARDAVRLINDILPLRTCRRSFRTARSYGSPCIELSLKRCLGPCMAQADPDAYRGLVNEVLGFLDGDDDRLLPILHRRLEQAAASHDFERASRLRDQIKRLDRLSLEQAQLDVIGKIDRLLVVLPAREGADRQVWFLVRGVRWASFEIEDGTTAAALARRLETARSRAEEYDEPVAMTHHTVDEASIISRWVRKYESSDAIIRWDNGLSADEVAERLLIVDPLDPDVTELVRDEEEH
ncbi:DEDD exonuclease domain-containing protein [soil metagenome]